MSYYDERNLFEYLVDKVIELKMELKDTQTELEQADSKFQAYRELKIKEDKERV